MAVELQFFDWPFYLAPRPWPSELVPPERQAEVFLMEDMPLHIEATHYKACRMALERSRALLGGALRDRGVCPCLLQLHMLRSASSGARSGLRLSSCASCCCNALGLFLQLNLPAAALALIGILCNAFNGQWPSLHQKEVQPDDATAGREENLFSAEPFVLEHLFGLNVVQVSCGGNHCAILEKRPGEEGEEGGQVWIWGLGNGGRLGIKRPKKTSDVQEILKNSRCSADAVASLMSNRAYVQSLTGDNKKWSLYTPVRVKFGSRIASISCGTDYTLALTEDGSIYAWGVGSYGNVSTGLICDQYEPALV
eukprot:s3169_g5.t1